jgi:hypothetical protein
MGARQSIARFKKRWVPSDDSPVPSDRHADPDHDETWSDFPDGGPNYDDPDEMGL